MDHLIHQPLTSFLAAGLATIRGAAVVEPLSFLGINAVFLLRLKFCFYLGGPEIAALILASQMLKETYQLVLWPCDLCFSFLEVESMLQSESTKNISHYDQQ